MYRKILFLILVFYSISFSQVNIQLYRNDTRGDVQYFREGIMDGNQVRTRFNNVGEVGRWPYAPSGEWPKGSGHGYLDGVCVLIAGEVMAPGTGKLVHPLETYYREWVDKDPVTGEMWTLTPVPGYSNPSVEKPSINTDPKSWPAVWPAALDLESNGGNWNGYWYGYFGKGVMNSDFETFFVMDDSRDKEYQRVPYHFYPIASDSSFGGLGMRVEVRGFQWSHVLAEDIIFWHYDIINISDNDYPNAAFGFYTDPGVGGKDDSGDDCASFDKKLDLTYAYDGDGYGVPNRFITGYYGYAYLESPGNETNGIDDDEDGVVDESRSDGIDNDHDWIGYLDINANGQWDPSENEPLNNDVGLDGIGPLDDGYVAPDFGEGDGVPTSGANSTGMPGEPNIDKTDKDESDQIGLNAVSLYRLGDGGTGGGWPKDDEPMWLKMVGGTFDTSLQRSNISMVFSSGTFPLKKAQRERFSMALLFGNDLEDLIFNKETVQQIYNANYNFSKPPIKPKLTAVAGDKQVFLYWDSKAEESRDQFLGYEQDDPTLGYKKDFEGYLIYRSTEPEFNDVKVITDSKGDAKYWKPIAQWDKKDGIKGPDPVGINGASFWRGSETGLQHSYIDTDVDNGQTYYYAVVSYDMGDPKFGTSGLQPSECTKIITQDYAGNIQFVDINCAVVVPNAPAAGYISANVEGQLKGSQGLGTGSLVVQVLNPNEIIEGTSYKISFNSTGTFPNYKTSTFDIIRTRAGVTDTIVTGLDTSVIGANRFSPPFDGLTLSVQNDTTIAVVDSMTGWTKGTSNVSLFIQPDITSRGIRWPADYEIQFFDSPQDTSFIEAAAQSYAKFPVNFKIVNQFTGQKSKVAIRDMDKSKTLTIGDEIQILEFMGPVTVGNSRIALKIGYFGPIDLSDPVEPQPGDKFFIKTSKPFYSSDFFTFSTKAVAVDNTKAGEELSKVDVVPNPYVGANTWEARNLSFTGRGERRIDFINLPADCTVRIYTINGALVKTLVKNSAASNGALTWNLVTEDGMDIAYGVYIYHVDAPGIGEHIGKFAVIK